MDSQLDKIINFVKRTGDKVIVLKDDYEFVVSSLDDYSRLVEVYNPVSQLSEIQMLDKINRDIALWRESQKEFDFKKDESDLSFEPKESRYDPLDLVNQDEIDKLNNEVGLKEDLEEEEEDNDFQPPKFDSADFEDIKSEDFDYPDIFKQDNKDNQDKFKIKDQFKGNVDTADNDEMDIVGDTPSNDPMDMDFEDLEDMDDSVFSDMDSDTFDMDSDEDDMDSDTDKFKIEDKGIQQNFEPKAEKKEPVDSPINNFGYNNPDDTGLNDSSAQDSWLELNENKENTNNFEHIPSPPDIEKNS